MWRIIFRKEFVEVFGDARTRFNVIVGPLLITPLVRKNWLRRGACYRVSTRA